MTTSSTHPDLDAKSATLAICARYGDDPNALLEILHDLQEEIGYVPRAMLPVLAGALNLSRAEVQGVVSFYHDFHAEPVGRVQVKVCRAEACQSMGATRLIESLCARRGIELGGTSLDGSITVEAVYCLGNCALSPAALINGKPYGRLDDGRLDAAIEGAR